MMKGLMDFLTGDSAIAKKLRHKFIFKLIPMLNPDGVIVGNTRSSLTGKDLNRQYRTVIRETYPSIWYTKTMIKRLTEELGVSLYCDMHAHSRKHNIFIYGCENKRDAEKKLAEQVFPLMLHKNVADKVWHVLVSKFHIILIMLMSFPFRSISLALFLSRSFHLKVVSLKCNAIKRERAVSLYGCLALPTATRWKLVLVVRIWVAER